MTARRSIQPEAEPVTVPLAAVPESRSLHRKLAEVMAEVERIPKNGTAPGEMGGFKFVQVGDAADAIRKALGTRGVSMLPTAVEIVGETEHETKRGGTMTTQSIRMTWTLTDGDTGETAVIQSLGTGADTGDKFSPKAQSSGMKYALLMGFLLSTGDDPEQTDTSDRRARRPMNADERDAVVEQAATRQGFAPPAFAVVRATHSDGLIGTAQQGKGDADFELRQTSQGPRLAFRLIEGRRGVKIVARGILAEMVAESRTSIEGQVVTLWGSVEDAEPFTPAGATKPVTYQYVALERLKVGALDLTAPDPEEITVEQASFGVPDPSAPFSAQELGDLASEAESVPLFPVTA